MKLDHDRLLDEIQEAIQKVKEAYDDLVAKHDENTQKIEDDEAFQNEERWLEESQDMYLQIEKRANDFILKKKNNPRATDESVGGSVQQLEVNFWNIGRETQTKGAESETVEETLLTDAPEQQATGTSNDQEIPTNDSIQADNTIQASQNKLTCGFKMEKPKMPHFAGDVCDYVVFWADFKHAVDSKCSKKDAISLLRTSLSGKPLELIKGIGSDYNAAWEHLDALYGDPRFVTDTVTYDISKFRPLQEDEDGRFCDLAQLVRRSYNTLKEVKRPFDMNNNHMIAIIEQEMHMNDRKAWSRHLERSGKKLH